MIKVIVYCGESIQDKCGKQQHPLNDVKDAERMVLSSYDRVAYSNSPDFVAAVKYIGEKHNVETIFYLDGVNKGNDIEEIFTDFNKSLDLINELSA